MTLCGVHDNMHVHTTVAHTCDYPLYLYRHTYNYIVQMIYDTTVQRYRVELKNCKLLYYVWHVYE